MIAVWIKSEETVQGEVANQTSGVPKPPALGSRLSALIKESVSQKRAAVLKGVYGRAPVFIVIHQGKSAGASSDTSRVEMPAKSDHF